MSKKGSKDIPAEAAAPVAAPASGEPLLVAIDDGYAQCKGFGVGADGQTVKFKFRSSARPGRHGLTALSGKGGGVGSYTTEEGERFTVSEAIEGENTQFDGFHTSTMNRTLVHHALMMAGYGGHDVHLVCGLPVKDYYVDNEKDEGRIAAKKANLLKGVTAASGKPLARIAKIDIACQAVAAFIDYVTADDLSERADPTGKIAVVDIGGRTTDIAVIVDGESLDNRMSGSENIGVLDVYTAVNRGIGKMLDFEDQLPINVIDAAVRTGKVNIWDTDHDVAQLVADVVREQEGKIAREVQRKLGSAASLKKVIFVGGGSALFQNIASHFRNGVMIDDPEFANARGMFKYARLFGAE